MARVTVEDCLEEAPNRFALVHLAAKRALQIKKGEEPLIDSDNKEVVTALREIAKKKVAFDVNVDDLLTGRIHKQIKKRTRRRRPRVA